MSILYLNISQTGIGHGKRRGYRPYYVRVVGAVHSVCTRVITVCSSTALNRVPATLIRPIILVTLSTTGEIPRVGTLSCLVAVELSIELHHELGSTNSKILVIVAVLAVVVRFHKLLTLCGRECRSACH